MWCVRHLRRVWIRRLVSTRDAVSRRWLASGTPGSSPGGEPPQDDSESKFVEFIRHLSRGGVSQLEKDPELKASMKAMLGDSLGGNDGADMPMQQLQDHPYMQQLTSMMQGGGVSGDYVDPTAEEDDLPWHLRPEVRTKPPTPPTTPPSGQPYTSTRPEDPFQWMESLSEGGGRDADAACTPTEQYFSEESEYGVQLMMDTRELQTELNEKIKARLGGASESAVDRYGPYIYFSAQPGASAPNSSVPSTFPVYKRVHTNAGSSEEMVIDFNDVSQAIAQEMQKHPGFAQHLEQDGTMDVLPYMSPEVVRVSPDNSKVAVLIDITGQERYVLLIRDIGTGRFIGQPRFLEGATPSRERFLSTLGRLGVPDSPGGVPYSSTSWFDGGGSGGSGGSMHGNHAVVGFEWDADGDSFFYVTCDQHGRPFQLFQHSCTAMDQNAARNIWSDSATMGGSGVFASSQLLYEEQDPGFSVHISKTSDEKMLILTSAISGSSELFIKPLASPDTESKQPQTVSLGEGARLNPEALASNGFRQVTHRDDNYFVAVEHWDRGNGPGRLLICGSHNEKRHTQNGDNLPVNERISVCEVSALPIPGTLEAGAGALASLLMDKAVYVGDTQLVDVEVFKTHTVLFEEHGLSGKARVVWNERLFDLDGTKGSQDASAVVPSIKELNKGMLQSQSVFGLDYGRMVPLPDIQPHVDNMPVPMSAAVCKVTPCVKGSAQQRYCELLFESPICPSLKIKYDFKNGVQSVAPMGSGTRVDWTPSGDAGNFGQLKVGFHDVSDILGQYGCVTVSVPAWDSDEESESIGGGDINGDSQSVKLTLVYKKDQWDPSKHWISQTSQPSVTIPSVRGRVADTLTYPESLMQGLADPISPDNVSIVQLEQHFAKHSPCLLQAYGAYGEPPNLSFDPARLVWLDRGWLVSWAHVRGGAGGGENWHQQGKYQYKQRSILDYLWCARWLVEQGISMPASLVGSGTSAGALTVASAALQNPRLFKSVLLRSGFVDVLSSMQYSHLPITMHEAAELGDPTSDPTIASCMGMYSPYDVLVNAEQKLEHSAGGSSDALPWFMDKAFYGPSGFDADLHQLWSGPAGSAVSGKPLASPSLSHPDVDTARYLSHLPDMRQSVALDDPRVPAWQSLKLQAALRSHVEQHPEVEVQDDGKLLRCEKAAATFRRQMALWRERWEAVKEPLRTSLAEDREDDEMADLQTLQRFTQSSQELSSQLTESAHDVHARSCEAIRALLAMRAVAWNQARQDAGGEEPEEVMDGRMQLLAACEAAMSGAVDEVRDQLQQGPSVEVLFSEWRTHVRQSAQDSDEDGRDGSQAFLTFIEARLVEHRAFVVHQVKNELAGRLAGDMMSVTDGEGGRVWQGEEIEGFVDSVVGLWVQEYVPAADRFAAHVLENAALLYDLQREFPDEASYSGEPDITEQDFDADMREQTEVAATYFAHKMGEGNVFGWQRKYGPVSLLHVDGAAGHFGATDGDRQLDSRVSEMAFAIRSVEGLPVSSSVEVVGQDAELE